MITSANKKKFTILTKFRLSNLKTLLSEISILLAVWLIINLIYYTADIHQSSKAKRYKLEQISFTQGIERPNFINDICGKDFRNQLYSNKQNDYLNISNCHEVYQNLGAYHDQAVQHLKGINQALANTWISIIELENETKIINNETERQLEITLSKNRQQWLGLNNQGTLDEIYQLLKFSLQEPNVLNDYTMPEYTISLMAIAEGDKKFPYSVVFKNHPDLINLANETANRINLIYSTNSNQKLADQAESLIQPIGNIKHLSAVVQVMIWSFITLILIGISRYVTHPFTIIPIVTTLWGLVIVLFSHDVIAPIKVGIWLFILGVFGSILTFFKLTQRPFLLAEDNRTASSSKWLYPTYVLLTSLGLLILIDLSARGYLTHRYLFLKHFNILFYCYVIISMSIVFNHILGLLLKQIILPALSISIWSSSERQKYKSMGYLAMFVSVFIGLTLVLRSDSSKISELSKFWFIIFLGLFLATNQRTLIESLNIKSKRKIFLLSFTVLLPLLMLLIANEKGTILTIAFTCIFLVGVALNNKIFHMGGRGHLLGIFTSMSLLLVLVTGLVHVSGLDSRTSERVQTWISPFISTNDQMAIIHWFRDSTPALGYGLGNVPWCGFNLTTCQGVPLQMQSDYTITSLIAITGMNLAFVVMFIYFFWLIIGLKNQSFFVNHHTKNTSVKSQHVLLAWVSSVWVLVTVFQAMVTIAGNFGMLPLTGVTLPFLSYGNSSLLFNTIMFCTILFIPDVRHNNL